MKRLTLEAKIFAAFLVALLFFAGSAFMYLSSTAQLLEAVARQTELGRIRADLREALSAMKDAETGQRGFLIAGDDAYLRPYDTGRKAVGLHMARLQRSLAGDRSVQPRLDDIAALWEIRSAKLANAIVARRAQGFEAARTLLVGSHGKADMDRIRVLFAGLLQAMDVRQQETLQRLEQARADMAFKLWVLFGLMGLLLTLAYWAILHEVRERRHLANQLRHQASHDGLTGLPNRRFFNDWLEMALAAARREQGQVALLYMDLDGFKRVNDQLGHETGDRLLMAASQRFRATARESDVIARLGGDEFALLTAAGSEADSPEVLAQRLLAALAVPLLPELGSEFPVGVSIGFALYPQDAATPDQLMHAADEAMYAAKRAGKNCIRIFSTLAAATASGDEPGAS